ncbi:MAG TPA: N-acetylmannosamine-6-phosphate 2-epimerase [Pyrinomonadaceae bacterium]|jgi:N-acylglucosamine-6-phosphate 2-epimerase|nr:N-acetylmannosamine-6-phosphate 2-epimerase [Pyrinomonadaceae bacterium]
MKLEEIIAAWQGGLIVSCQAAADSPLARPDIIAALALAAARNGAVGVRIDGAENIVAVRGAGVNVPIVGIEKQLSEGSGVYITPTYDSAARIAGSGADVVALDATERERPGGEKLRDIVRRIQRELRRPVMADAATYEEGLSAAEEAGADFIGTTLSGYTAETAGNDAPDFPLVERLAARLSVPVICEGRLRSAEDVRRAFECGAFAVVIGGAITGVDWLVRHYVAATERGRRSEVRGK